MKVGIIGAGTMGSGIAQAFAQTEGYEVFCATLMKNLLLTARTELQRLWRRELQKENGAGCG